MELLREWFMWGESDLFIFGVIIIVIAAFFPLRLEKNRKNRIIIVACLAIYATVSYTHLTLPTTSRV